MSDLIGRFLGFEERLGRGLVKFAYYILLIFLCVAAINAFFLYIFRLEFVSWILVPFQFIGLVIALRVVAEALLAILSIQDDSAHAEEMIDGFESGITPRPTAPAATATVHEPSKPAAMNAVEDADESEEEETASKPAAKKTTKKAAKKSAKKSAANGADSSGTDDTPEGSSAS